MAPKWVQAKRNKKEGTPLAGQRAITGFLVGGSKPATPAAGPRAATSAQPSSAAGTSAAAEAAAVEGSASPPPTKRQKMGEHELPGTSAEAPQRRRARPISAAPSAADARQALQQKLGLAGDSAGAQAGAVAAAAAAAAGARRQGPIEPEFVSDPALPLTAKDKSKLTPLELQVTELKRANPGVVLAVEVGYKFKFYGADAEIASRELGIYSYQDRSFLCTGVPFPRLHFHLRRLVLAGHKVGVVRQVETAAIKKAGDNKSGPFERRLTALYTRSTIEAGELGGLADVEGEDDDEDGGAAEPGAAAGAGRPAARRAPRGAAPHIEPLPSSYLVCCVEQPVGSAGGAGGGAGNSSSSSGGPSHSAEIGLVAVEPSTGAVLHTQFRDGLMRQELESRLLFASPAELLLAQPASSETRRLCEHIGEQLGCGAAAPRLELAPAGKYGGKTGGAALAAVLAFYGSAEAVSDDDGEEIDARDSLASGSGAAPPVIEPAPAAALAAVRALPPLVLRALAHLLDYLQPFGLQSVLRLGASFQPWATAQEMRLSANTLRQLEIFNNNVDGGKKGSLLAILDHTQTAMGRRLLRSWAGKPLRQRDAIEARQEAVQELAEQGSEHPVLSRLAPTLKMLSSSSSPDLERGITRAFHGNARPSDFAALLKTFSTLHELLGIEADLAAADVAADVVPVGSSSRFSSGSGTGRSMAEGGGDRGKSLSDEGASMEGGGLAAAMAAPPPPLRLRGVASPLLRQLLRAAGDLRVAAAARQLLASMDLKAAEANDKLTVLKDSEVFPEVRRWRDEVAAVEGQLADLLKQFRRQLQISTLQYLTVQNLGAYLLEVPENLVKRVPKDWQKVNSVKKGTRFRPPEVKTALQQLDLAREHLQAACAAAWRQFLRGFADLYLPFRSAVQALAGLDCLAGLAQLASSPGYCRPQLLDSAAAPPQLHIEAGRHPVVELLLEGSGQQFVPNDTHLQADAMRCAIITGPNMGGKSCFTRQCALIAIMAQIGSFVPAASARLTPLDGVFTRMGAADNLALGRSTFAEELGETSSILAAATASSLVILDELGRGTSTGDGAAIAEACLRHMVAGPASHPLTLFITHYPEVCLRLQAALPQAVACFRMAHAEEEGGGMEQQPQQEEHAQGAAAAGGRGSHQQREDPAASQEGLAQEQQQGEERESNQPGEQQQGEGDDGGDEPFACAPPSPPAQLPALGRIVFLFKLVEGVAPASYGLNVARMAQLPAAVIRRAAEVAARAQAEAEARRSGVAAVAAQQQGQQGQAGAGSGRSGGAAEELVLLASQCRQFLGGALEDGRVDAEAGRALQQRAWQLLAQAGS